MRINARNRPAGLSYRTKGRGKMTKATIHAADIRRICGDIADWKVAAIQEAGGGIDALEEAVAWSSGDDENPPVRHLPPGSPAAKIYAVLIAGEEEDEDHAGR